MALQKLIIYKISVEGKLVPIESALLLEAFTPIDALTIYVHEKKRLYIWKGKDIGSFIGKYVPEAKDLILKADPAIRILRHIVVESGNEPQDFFDDLNLQPDKLKAQLAQAGKTYGTLTANIAVLRISEQAQFKKREFDLATTTAQDLINLGVKLNDLPLIKEQQEFLSRVDTEKQKINTLEAQQQNFANLIAKLQGSLYDGKLDEAHESATLIRAILARSKNAPENLELIDMLRREEDLYRDYHTREEGIKVQVAMLSKTLEEEIRRGDLEFAQQTLEKLEDKYQKSSSTTFKEEWESKTKNLRDRVEKQLAAVSKFQEIRNHVENAIRDAQFEKITDLKLELGKNREEIEVPHIKNALEAYLDSIDEKVDKQRQIIQLKKKVTNDLREIEKSAKSLSTEEAIKRLEQISSIITVNQFSELAPQVEQVRAKIQPQNEEHKKDLELLERLEHYIEQNSQKKQWDIAIKNCEKLLEVVTKSGKDDLVSKYQTRLTEFRGKLDLALAEEKKKQDELLQKASDLQDIIKTEKNVLPVVENFSAKDLLGTISQDVDEMMARVGDLLATHRVEIKSEVQSKGTLRSTTGEIISVEHTATIQPSTPQSATDTAVPAPQPNFTLQSGLENPLNSVIEEAVLKDLIPYNFEITEFRLNGESPAQEPARNLTEDGMEVTWTLKNIAPKEKVAINYDLRRRVSRTLILTFSDALKIIKTHTALAPLPSEGLYDALLNFTNTFPSTLQFAVIEDILPLYYLFEIKQPEVKPALTSDNPSGTIVKWNAGTIAPNGRTVHQYRLLELFRFEELKIKASSHLKTALDALEAGDIKDALNEWEEYHESVNTALRVPASIVQRDPNITALKEQEDILALAKECAGKIKATHEMSDLVNNIEILLQIIRRSGEIREEKEQRKIEDEKQKEEEERQRKEEEELAAKKVEEERQRKEAEELAAKTAEEERQRKEAEELAAKTAEEERQRKEAEELAAKTAGEERKRKEAEELAAKTAEEERKRKEENTKQGEELALKLQQAEENFQNCFADKKYSECIDKIPEIVELAKQLQKKETVVKFENLKQEIETNIAEEEKLATVQKEKLEKIKKLKKDASDFEGRLLFKDAKTKYQTAKDIAIEINDKLTVTFCEQRITQLELWEKEMAGSDLMRWDISPFKIINRLRYNYLEVMNDKDGAQKRVAELTNIAGKKEVFKLVTLVRSKFKGQGPFNDKGECFTIYGRKGSL